MEIPNQLFLHLRENYLQCICLISFSSVYIQAVLSMSCILRKLLINIPSKLQKNTLILGVDKPTMCVTKRNKTKKQKQKKHKALSDAFGTFIALENESQA